MQAFFDGQAQLVNSRREYAQRFMNSLDGIAGLPGTCSRDAKQWMGYHRYSTASPIIRPYKSRNSVTTSPDSRCSSQHDSNRDRRGRVSRPPQWLMAAKSSVGRGLSRVEMNTSNPAMWSRNSGSCTVFMMGDAVEIPVIPHPLLCVLLLHVPREPGDPVQAVHEALRVLAPAVHELCLAVEECLHRHEELLERSANHAVPCSPIAFLLFACPCPWRLETAYLRRQVCSSVDTDAVREVFHDLAQCMSGEGEPVGKSVSLMTAIAAPYHSPRSTRRSMSAS